MARNEFKYESLEDTESIAAYLTALAEGFGTGRLAFSTNGREFVTEPHGLLQLRVDAKRSSSGTRITLKVSWRADPPPSENGEGSFSIKPKRD